MQRDRTSDQFCLIKDLLREWAGLRLDRQRAYPSQAAFATERVDNCHRNTETYYEDLPPRIAKLSAQIECMAPSSQKIIEMEYLDRRPQKTKAAELGMPREVFSSRLRWIHEQLDFVVFKR